MSTIWRDSKCEQIIWPATLFVKTPFDAVPSAGERDEIISRTVGELRKELFINGKWYADYVRLRMKAVRA